MKLSKITGFLGPFAWPVTLLLFGVLLPITALLVELSTQMCRDTIHFDPIPTLWHILAVASVPTVLGVWASYRFKGHLAASPVWRLAIGWVTGVSLCYAIPFIPIIPLALIVAFFGIGLLPLAPVGTTIVGLVAMYKTQKEVGGAGWWGTLGFVTGLVVILGLAGTQITIENLVNKASSENEIERSEGISELRNYSHETISSFTCDYKRPSWPNPIKPVQVAFDTPHHLGSFKPEIFWRVTGERCENDRWNRQTRFITRSNTERNLEIVSSRFDTSVSANSGIAYTEWLYEVKNSERFQQEADFIVQLPEDGVVSRVTLWVHGEPREATFAGKGKAEEAYRAIVAKSRDPILVSEETPGRIRVRMFPVPAGAVMKARIGVTHSSRLQETKTKIVMPKIVSGNVTHKYTTHRVWVESAKPLTSNFDLETTNLRGTEYAKGEISDKHLGELEIIAVAPQPKVFVPFGEGAVVQTIEKTKRVSPDHLTLVVDGSRGMDEYREAVASAVESLTDVKNLTLIFSSDAKPVVRYENISWNASSRERVVDAIRTYEFVGGRDAVPALREAQDQVQKYGGPLFWIFSSQQIGFGSFVTLQGRDSVVIDALQVDGERDVNASGLHASARLRSIKRSGSVGADLTNAFHKLGPHPEISRETTNTLPDAMVPETSKHLSRLYVYDRVSDLLRQDYGTPEQTNRNVAIQLAGEAQIVTSVSSAIVLETEAQYRQFGLDQATGDGVPTIPEPEEWALIIVGTLGVLYAGWRRRREEEEESLEFAS